jgi:hypothetical protein
MRTECALSYFFTALVETHKRQLPHFQRVHEAKATVVASFVSSVARTLFCIQYRKEIESWLSILKIASLNRRMN